MSTSKVVRVLATASLVLLVGACARSGDLSPQTRLGSRHRDGIGGPGGNVDRADISDISRRRMSGLTERGDDIVYFASDSSTLTPEAMRSLDLQVEWLRHRQGHAATIEGHADERGTREYNIALGARRANAVKEYLVQRGVPAARIRTTSYGKERPVAVCDDISCWSQNRRAQTVPSGLELSRR